MPSPNLWAPWVRIATPSVLLDSFVTEFTVAQEESRHEWAQVSVRYHLPAAFRPVLAELPPQLWWPESTPVRISYGPTPGRGSVFVGYVVSPELVTNTDTSERHTAGQLIDIKYTLLGATMTMQSARERLWRESGVAYMAEQIAADHGLSVLTSPHPKVMDRQQAAQSDFAFLRERARETGWRLATRGTRLAVTDPRQALNRFPPRFDQHSTPGKQDTMQAFKAIVGELDPAGERRAQHATAALSPAGVVASASATLGDAPAPVRRWDLGVNASYQEAAYATQAATLRDVWWAHAQATVDGDVSLEPGAVVRLGGAALTDQYTGAWMVRSARHRFVLAPTGPRYGSYYTDLTLGRDRADRLTYLPAQPSPVVGSELIGGRWQARRRQL